MSIKKSLLAVAAAALATMAFAAPAMASHLEDVEGGPPEAGHTTHYRGWTKFTDSTGSGIICHATSETEATETSGETGKVTAFGAENPNTEKCETFGELAELGCNVENNGVEATNLPYNLETNGDDLEVSAGANGPIVIHTRLEGFFCPDLKLTVDSPVTLKPLETGSGVTNAPNLGATAGTDTPIAGVELEGTGEVHIPLVGTRSVTIEGELEATGEDLCTWELVA